MNNFIIMALKVALIWTLIENSGFIEDIEKKLQKPLYRFTKPFKFEFGKPINCAFCMTFWSLIAVMIITPCFSIDNLIITLIAAYMTDILNDLQFFVIDGIKKLIEKLRVLLKL